MLSETFEYTRSMIVSEVSVSLVGEQTSCDIFKFSCVFCYHALTGPVLFNMLK